MKRLILQGLSCPSITTRTTRTTRTDRTTRTAAQPERPHNPPDSRDSHKEASAEVEKLALYGFNNLTKTLSFNIYDICYAKSERQQQDYIEYIDEQYNSERLTSILLEVTDMIGAHVLNISKQDYDPQGASVDILIADQGMPTETIDPSNNLGVLTRCAIDEEVSDTQREIYRRLAAHHDEILGHLDKSHLTVHTFPEYHPNNAISTFRVDIEVATCGRVSPLSTLDFLISSFDSDIMTIDYRVRGFTRDRGGRKYFLDHDITSIQDYIGESTLALYDALDINVYQSNLFHTKLLIKDIALQKYVFNDNVAEMDDYERQQITQALRREMIEIYSGKNIYEGR